MMDSIQCACGYVGPCVSQGTSLVCPICRTPADTSAHAPAAVVPEFSVSGAIPAVPDEPPLESRKTFKIPCPNGHVNVTPAHMIGTQVVCPKCNAFYVLQLADSLEYRQVAEREAQAQAEEQAKLWLNRAVYAAIFIVVSLLGMIIVSLFFGGPRTGR